MSDAAHLSREPRPRTFVRHTPARACAHDGDGPRRLHERAEHRNSRGAAAHGGRGAGQSGEGPAGGREGTGGALTIVVHQLFNQVHVRHEHSPAAWARRMQER